MAHTHYKCNAIHIVLCIFIQIYVYTAIYSCIQKTCIIMIILVFISCFLVVSLLFCCCVFDTNLRARAPRIKKSKLAALYTFFYLSDFFLFFLVGARFTSCDLSKKRSFLFGRELHRKLNDRGRRTQAPS